MHGFPAEKGLLINNLRKNFLRSEKQMPLNLASPGIVVREVDLTIGRVVQQGKPIGALVAPFTKGRNGGSTTH